MNVDIFNPHFVSGYVLSSGTVTINLEAEKGSGAGLYFNSTDDIRELVRAMTAWADEQDGAEK